jgi:hypothetical protein
MSRKYPVALALVVTLAVAAVMLGWVGNAHAQVAQTLSWWRPRPRPRPVPEIDLGTLRATGTLLVGGLLVLADRFRRR